jgi:hypothetical protein
LGQRRIPGLLPRGNTRRRRRLNAFHHVIVGQGSLPAKAFNGLGKANLTRVFSALVAFQHPPVRAAREFLFFLHFCTRGLAIVEGRALATREHEGKVAQTRRKSGMEERVDLLVLRFGGRRETGK